MTRRWLLSAPHDASRRCPLLLLLLPSVVLVWIVRRTRAKLYEAVSLSHTLTLLSMCC